MTDENETQAYKDLVEKYKVKKTTDDCYTPYHVYAAVKDLACRNYDIGQDRPIVRPFFPGGDYENFDYPENCIVIDNPPFSILSKIIRFYSERKIDYFLFAPTLTCFNAGRERCNYVITDVSLTYENGARIRTSFVTNLGECAIFADPSIDEMLKVCESQTTGKPIRNLLGIDYPVQIATTTNIAALVRHGVQYKVSKGQCAYISHVGEDRSSIFGGGMILTEEAAAKIPEEPSLLRKKIVLSDADRRLQKSICQKPDIEQGELGL